MGFESPASILYDTRGVAQAVSGGLAVPVSTSALLMAGMSTEGTASVLRTLGDGTLVVSGVGFVFPTVITQGLAGTQPEGWFVRITDGTQVLGTGSSAPLWISGTVSVPTTLTVTGSVTIPTTVTITGSVTVTNTIPVTGSVGITEIVNVTGSVGITNTVPVTGSVTIPTTVTVTGSVGVVNILTVTGSVALAASLPSGSNNLGGVGITSDPAEGLTGSTAPLSAMLVGGRESTGGTLLPFLVGSDGTLNTTGSFGVTNFLANQRVPSNEQVGLLTSGSTFTGSYVDVSKHQGFSFFYISPQPFTASILWSSDGVTQDTSVVGIAAFSSVPVDFFNGFYVGLYQATYIINRYFKVQVVNSSSNQTMVRSFCNLSNKPVASTLGNIDDDLTNVTKFLYTRSVTAGVRPDGTFSNIPLGGSESDLATETLLAADEVYTSGWVNVEGYSSIGINVNSDQSSAVNGLVLEFSHDASEVISSRTFTYVGGSGQTSQGKFFPLPIQGAYARITYTNGAIGQNQFDLHTLLSTAAYQSPQLAYDQPIPNTSQALMTRGSLLAKDDAGLIDDVTKSPSGGLRVSVVEHETETPVKAMTTFKTGQANIANETTPVASPALFNRKTIRITNLDTVLNFYWGDSTVDDSTGDVIFPLTTKEIPLSSSATIYGFAQPTTGAFTTTTVTGSAVTSTGAISASNVIADDSSFATFTAQGQTISLSGFNLSTTDPVFSPVKLFFKAKNDGVQFSTSSYQETVSASATGGTSIASPVISGTSGSVYIAAIANGQTTPRDVLSVTGLGLTWTRKAAQTNSTATGYIHLYVSTGIPTLASGTVTANFTAAVQNSAIAISRFNNVDTANPVLNSGSVEAAGAGTATVLGGPISGSNIGIFYAAVNGITRTSITWTSPTADIFDFRSSTNVLLAGTTTQSLGGNNSVTGTVVGGNADWVLGFLTLNPAQTLNPLLVLSYTLSGVQGPTVMTSALSSSTESTFTMDVTSDRVWTQNTINALTMSLSCSLLQGSNALVNQMAELITSANSSSLIRISVAELG